MPDEVQQIHRIGYFNTLDPLFQSCELFHNFSFQKNNPEADHITSGVSKYATKRAWISDVQPPGCAVSSQKEKVSNRSANRSDTLAPCVCSHGR